MKAIVDDIKTLEKTLIDKGLNELILMENAGIKLAKIVKKYAKKLNIKNSEILFLLGGGNNGVDALVALRHLKQTKAYKLGFKENAYFKKQEQILKNFGFKFMQKEPKLKKFKLIVDCILGTGCNRALDEKYHSLIQKVNQSKAFKIACDLPTNLGFQPCFKADLTVCMGALKTILLEDFAKESVGKIKIGNLGIHTKQFQAPSTHFLLEKKDLKLIKRKINSHKGNYGHVYIVASASAGTLAGLGALNFGAGLVSLIAQKSFSPLLMLKEKIEKNANAIALGMGLENLDFLKEEILQNIPLVLDANVFLSKTLLGYLNRKDVIISPHPKEFIKLYKMCFNHNLDLEILQKNRFLYAKAFTQKYNCVLVLKGANTIIAQKEKLFVLNIGNACLAKAGSGDVLNGMIAALLGSGFNALEAAKNACLAHALVAKNYKFNHNSFDALKLIKGLKCL
ncbi:NAD(P)H-hydrate dehydratase [Campylobacter hepaticus]|uniref:NAD(P)H-hydrate dehydratase n=1 Tax=Campylobacter hepaticus TaxID=1813019 RepID=UPI0029B338E9|nr:NAD(P)H-hydrate dehydratase [Campylobacter hepaticus]MDX2331344.1 NAD(P)H-hydrate dehydratase [Campylobacter hepaticus]MDX2371959.1 NAD(P)H-hydrate dehydratase [Campylobacter hepaticus]MDX2397305.1 NAD(P)H-hydrate dehydratase [Campylobacter hepaticus]MDX5509117.1 NAD(P)H-hydrate dehydratase [Campylobacter hepaticus]